MTNEQELAILKKMNEMSEDEWELYRETKEFRTFFKQTMNEITKIKEEHQLNKIMKQSGKEGNTLNV